VRHGPHEEVRPIPLSALRWSTLATRGKVQERSAAGATARRRDGRVPRRGRLVPEGLIFLLVGVVSGCASLLPETTFASIEMGDGSLEVRREEQVAPAAFVRQTVRFYYLDEDGERFLAQTMLDDDGANPSERNVAATMISDGTWQVTLMGQQQADERWLVELGSGDPRMRKVDLTTDAAGGAGP
jgi:hypothetical protein